MNINQMPLDDNEYIQEPTKKISICVHHTSGHTVDKKGLANMNHFNGWNTDDSRVGAHYSIDHYGKIYQHLPDEDWIYHLGVKHKNSKLLNQQSIGIELCNEGWLTPHGATYKAGLGFTYQRDPAEVHIEDWRGHKYWAPYSDQQMESLIWLVKFLQKKHEIGNTTMGFGNYRNPNSTDKLASAYWKGEFNGIYTHNNVREDKTDVSPAFMFEYFVNKLLNG